MVQYSFFYDRLIILVYFCHCITRFSSQLLGLFTIIQVSDTCNEIGIGVVSAVVSSQ